MTSPVRLSVAGVAQLAASLTKSKDESFILIHRDNMRDEWGIELSEHLDGLLVANLLNAFQGKLLESLLEQQQLHVDAQANTEKFPNVTSPTV